MKDTKVGTMAKDDQADVARSGYDAMVRGERSVVYGLTNAMQVATAKVVGGGAAAEMHRKQAAPGTAEAEGKSKV